MRALAAVAVASLAVLAHSQDAWEQLDFPTDDVAGTLASEVDWSLSLQELDTMEDASPLTLFAQSGPCPFTWTRDLSQGSSGADVQALQRFLNRDTATRVASSGPGSPGQETTFYGPATTAAVSRFQSKYAGEVLHPLGLRSPTGYFGSASRNKANAMCGGGRPGPSPPPSSGTTNLGRRLADAARAEATRRNTVGWCYAGVATVVNRLTSAGLWGASAYMAADQLARSSQFREVRWAASDLPRLSAGAIVVWPKTGASPHGHISIALGDGREASDHISRQMTSLRGYTSVRVFLPK